jgi:cation diffusion facilitator CzcD-associated flavoprotein CzcO
MRSKHYSIIIIGSGFGGQCAAINLLKDGIDDFVILERRSFIGGTWIQNSYPGAAVDVQSPLYSFSFESYDWTQLFAEQIELKAYTESIFQKYGLVDKTLTNMNVDQAEWDEVESVWRVHVNNNEMLTAQFLVNASGQLSKPVIPDFKGKGLFNGPSFHTNDWDHNVDYKGKRVAIIGSGASAAQVIPAIADKVKHLHVFQRTPHWVLPRNDYTFKPWQRRLLRQPWAYQLLRKTIYWALEFRVVGFKYSRAALNVLGGIPSRRLLEEQVKDPALRNKLTPDFTIGCKRILVSNTLYPALARENVTLHDKFDGIDSINESGIKTTQGNQQDVDIIVYSTGYDAADGLISYEVKGRNNQSLNQFWDDYPRAYLGTTVPHFPNFFVVTGPNTGIGHTSAIFVIESQIKYVINSIKQVIQNGKKNIEVLPEAEQRYTDKIHREMEKTVWHNGGCNSWYKSKSGKVIAMFPGFSFTYRYLCRKFKLADHKLT